MGIWTREVSLEAINERRHGSLIGHVGIEVVEVGEDGAVPDNSVMELSWDGYDGADWGSRSRIA